MLNKRVIKIILICLIAFVSFFVDSAHCRTEYDYIDITNPFIRKIPIAIPLFKSMSGGEKENSCHKKHQICSQDHWNLLVTSR